MKMHKRLWASLWCNNLIIQCKNRFSAAKRKNKVFCLQQCETPFLMAARSIPLTLFKCKSCWNVADFNLKVASKSFDVNAHIGRRASCEPEISHNKPVLSFKLFPRSTWKPDASISVFQLQWLELCLIWRAASVYRKHGLFQTSSIYLFLDILYFLED